MAEAGGEDGEEDGEDHDGEADHHATNATLPSVRQHSLLGKVKSLGQVESENAGVAIL